MGKPPSAARAGPRRRSQSASRVVYAATLLFGLVWLASNVREIGADSRAVVLEFGRIARTQDAGLLLAWPRPFEQVRLLPGPERQLSQPVAALTPVEGIAPAKDASDSASAMPATASPYLTGDNNLVLLDATLYLPHHRSALLYSVGGACRPALDRVNGRRQRKSPPNGRSTIFWWPSRAKETGQTGQGIIAMRAASP